MITKRPSQKRKPKISGRTPFWIKGVGQLQSGFEEKALAIFQPDILMPQQFLANYERKFRLDPERTLMLAILEDAVVCFQDNLSAPCKRRETLFLDAEAWFLSKDRSYLYSFENVCDALGFDADYLRQGLMAWKNAALAKPVVRERREQVAG